MATYVDIVTLEVKQASLVKLAPSVYADMVKVWFNGGVSNASKVPHDLELFTKINSGEIPKPETNDGWQVLSPAFPSFSSFSLFMLLHRRKQGKEWATLQDSFELLHHLLTPGNYRTGLRWTDISSRSGIIGPGTKVGPPYTGADPFLAKFTQFMEVGKVGNTLFSASKLLMGGGKSANEHQRIHNLVPGHMLQWLDYRELGIPDMSERTTDEIKREFYNVCTLVKEGRIDPMLFLKDSYSGPTTTSKSSQKPKHTATVDYSELPDL